MILVVVRGFAVRRQGIIVFFPCIMTKRRKPAPATACDPALSCVKFDGVHPRFLLDPDAVNEANNGKEQFLLPDGRQ